MTARGTLSSADLRRVEVFSDWLGFAHPPRHSAKLVITRGAGGSFTRAVEPAGAADELPAAAVDALAEALARPPVPRLDPALFPHLPEPVLRRHYDSRWTDDHPELLVRVTFAGGRTVTVQTNAQQAFMLPLKIRDESTSRQFETFDPALSRAIAGLLPNEFLNGERIGGNEGLLRYELDQHAKRQEPGAAGEAEDDQWRRLREYRHPDPFSEPLLRDEISADEVRRLLAAGADANVADDVRQTALMVSSYRGDAERFRLLAAAGADVEARRDGFTGLHLAAAGGGGDKAALWLRAGADVHARTPEGATALMLGARWAAVLEVLLPAGADVNAVDEDGHCALVYAIKEQCGVWPDAQLAAMRMLIDAGTNLAFRDKAGLTPLGHARQKLAQEQMAREVRTAIASADPAAADADPGRTVDPDTHESPLGWSDLRMAGEVVKLLEAAGAHD